MGAMRALEGLLPDQAGVEFYEENGYYVTDRVLPDEEIDEALRGAERHWAGERDWTLPVSGGFADWTPADGEGIRNSEYTALQNRQIRALVEHPVIGAIAARLTGSPTIRLWDDQLISKAPSSGPNGPIVGWHTDRAYWLTCTSEAMLTAWIPLQDTPEIMGPIVYVAGSHRWPGTESLRTFNSQDLDALEQRFGAAARSSQRVIALKKGQLSFHHSRMIHGSNVNRGDVDRVSIALHLQDASNRHRVFHNQAGIPWHIVNDDLARKRPDGTPDYTDPAVFPVLWPVDGDD